MTTVEPDGRALTRVMAIAFVLNALVLNALLWRFAPAGFNETVLHHTWALLHARGGDDSWGPMAAALDYAQAPQATPLYTEIFFNRHFKFQYPPSALLALAAMRLIDPMRVRIDDFYSGPWPSIDDMVALAFVALSAVASAAVLELRLRQAGMVGESRAQAWARIVLVAAFALTFYPLVKAFTLGQIQVWINGLFALSLLCWVIGRKAVSGALIGLICLVKPHFGLFLVWAALRREWRFAFGCIVVGAIGLAASIAVFGFADHVDYLGVLSYLSQRGEGYYPNQSVNGLLNRLVGIGAPALYGNLEFFPDRFPPFNPLVYAGSLVSAAAILIAALLHRQHDRVIDFATMAVSATMAAPIAWEHHYGVLLPVFACILASGPRRAAWWCWLGVSFVLTSTFIAAANLLAPSVLNVAQSYLFAGSVILLLLLHSSGSVSPVPHRA